MYRPPRRIGETDRRALPCRRFMRGRDRLAGREKGGQRRIGLTGKRCEIATPYVVVVARDSPGLVIGDRGDGEQRRRAGTTRSGSDGAHLHLFPAAVAADFFF